MVQQLRRIEFHLTEEVEGKGSRVNIRHADIRDRQLWDRGLTRVWDGSYHKACRCTGANMKAPCRGARAGGPGQEDRTGCEGTGHRRDRWGR